jgi:hypothetical protein
MPDHPTRSLGKEPTRSEFESSRPKEGLDFDETDDERRALDEESGMFHTRYT